MYRLGAGQIQPVFVMRTETLRPLLGNYYYLTCTLRDNRLYYLTCTIHCNQRIIKWYSTIWTPLVESLVSRWYMSPLAGRTVIALYPTAPLYCGCQIRFPGEQLSSNKRAPSLRRAAIEPSPLSLSLPLPLAIIYALIHTFNIVLVQAFRQESFSGLSVRCGVRAPGISIY